MSKQIMRKENFHIREEAQNLMEMMVFDELDSIEFVNWAVNSLSSGYESESLIIWAGLDKSDTEERKEYFIKSLEELGVELIEIKSESIIDMAFHISKSVIKKQISEISGLGKMLLICRESNYDEKYMNFYQIRDDVDLISDGYTSNYIIDLTNENLREKLRMEFVKFLEYNHGLKFRNMLCEMSNKQLIEIGYVEPNIYSNETLKIIVNIIEQRKLSEMEINEIIEELKRERGNMNK